ncbi:MAG: PAS domain S-box protein [Candidatus Eisenbacteria bacterium]|nr:PAS domain S-box protein [Candidatus Eisenbacteria bacterium]
MSRRQETRRDYSSLLKKVENLRSFTNLNPTDYDSSDDETMLARVCEDLTEALEATHRRLIETDTKLSVMREIAEGMLSNVRPEEALQTVSSYMHKVMGMEDVGLWLMNRETGLLQGQHTLYGDGEPRTGETSLRPCDLEGKLGASIWHMQTCVVTSEEVGRQLKIDVVGPGRPMAVVPLVSSRQWLSCREVKKCIRQECSAYLGKHGFCWETPDTLCFHEKGFEPSRKAEFCVKCDVFPLLGMLIAARGTSGEMSPGDLSMLESVAYNVAQVLESNRLYGALRVGEEFRQRILDSMGECMVGFDLSGRLQAFNRMAETVTGFSAEEVTGARSSFLIPPEEMAVSPVTRALRYGEELTAVDTVVRKRSRGSVPVRMTSRLLRDERDNVRGVIATFSDLRPVRRLEEKMRQLDRLAALGRFASSVAHEVRNPLSGIAAGIQYMSRQFGETGPEAENVKFLLREVARLERIIQDLLRITHPQELVIAEASVEDVVERALKSLGNLLTEKSLDLDMSVTGKLRLVEMDSDQIQQVFINLIKNAAEATPQGGRLKISMASVEGSDREPGGVQVTVADSGPGIRPEDADRILEPFFTTKPGGTGLGLYITHEIVRRHGGELSVANAPGSGAEFTVRLPACGPNRNESARDGGGGKRG